MTIASLAISCVATLLIGLLAGRCLRGSRAGIAAATATSMAMGLTLLQTTTLNDLFRIVQPKVAVDWLPLICLLAAAVAVAPSIRLRVLSGIVLSILTPLRLLWGSVYLPFEHVEASVWIRIAVWSVSIAAALLLEERQPRRRFNWNSGSWIAATVGTVVLVAMSGSLNYGAAAGVCGLAILGVLISTSQITNMAAVPLVCLIGLAASFAELPILMAALLLLAWFGVLTADRLAEPRFAATLRVGSVVVLLWAVSVTVSRMVESRGTAEMSKTGYGSFIGSEFPGSPSEEANPVQLPKEGTASAEQTGESADPFDGLATE